MSAAQRGMSPSVQALLDAGANKEAKEQSGRTALIWAAFNGHEGCVNILLAAGAEKGIQEKVTVDAMSPDNMGLQLMTSGLLGRVATRPSLLLLTTAERDAKALLDAGADADLQDGDGSTALILAASNGREGCVELLAEAGADRSAKNNDGDTALSLASNEAVKVILRGW